MSSTILVTGGTGVLGSHVVPLLRGEGRPVRVLSRRQHPGEDGVEYVTGDLLNDEGTTAAVSGVETILHLAGGPKGDDVATRNLVRAAEKEGVAHLVYISVIAVDRIPLGYYRSKLASERVIVESRVPWTTLRAAQFHDLVLKVLDAAAKLPLIPAPAGIRLQPVDSGEVAARLVALAAAGPAGLATDLAGPSVRGLPELIRSYLEAKDQRRRTMPLPIPGRLGRLYREGENLSLQDVDTGERTWESFLGQRVTALR
ncbi:SDR family oxidoreductase [Spiractinospora alimapuensis]|uniref:SDR family oxidoreductase n=1 Tax=Spiractinospora alimapuensis TaxID=2820884 RepID=UPI001F474B2D|nr:SDR family oxidoreductase [Spiractinospora alimapuensis]QVQ52752.1 SDR family oxidoreductase [Spiractinospora alimapuensis]